MVTVIEILLYNQSIFIDRVTQAQRNTDSILILTLKCRLMTQYRHVCPPLKSHLSLNMTVVIVITIIMTGVMNENSSYRGSSYTPPRNQSAIKALFLFSVPN